LGELDLVLELLTAPDGIGQRELLRRLRLSHEAVSSTITSLARRGIVERIPTEGDGRSWQVKLVSRDVDRALAVNLRLCSDRVDSQLGREGLAGLAALARVKRF
jgi:DNA-binding MarR family transcriptional regulator